MNAQEVFDAAVSGVTKQGRPSRGRKGQCLYRGPKGRKCAVGWLIPDELYVRRMEGLGVSSILSEWPGVLDDEHEELMYDLQIAHDAAGRGRDFLDRFKQRCREIAELHRLDPAAAK